MLESYFKRHLEHSLGLNKLKAKINKSSPRVEEIKKKWKKEIAEEQRRTKEIRGWSSNELREQTKAAVENLRNWKTEMDK